MSDDALPWILAVLGMLLGGLIAGGLCWALGLGSDVAALFGVLLGSVGAQVGFLIGDS